MIYTVKNRLVKYWQHDAVLYNYRFIITIVDLLY